MRLTLNLAVLLATGFGLAVAGIPGAVTGLVGGFIVTQQVDNMSRVPTGLSEWAEFALQVGILCGLLPVVLCTFLGGWRWGWAGAIVGFATALVVSRGVFQLFARLFASYPDTTGYFPDRFHSTDAVHLKQGLAGRPIAAAALFVLFISSWIGIVLAIALAIIGKWSSAGLVALLVPLGFVTWSTLMSWLVTHPRTVAA